MIARSIANNLHERCEFRVDAVSVFTRGSENKKTAYACVVQLATRIIKSIAFHPLPVTRIVLHAR